MEKKNLNLTSEPMTREEYKDAMDDVIYLCTCAINGKVPDRERAAKMNLTRLYQASRRHTLTAIVAYALESAGIKDNAFTQAKAKAIRKVGMMEAEMRILFERMEQAGIWYLPLKGIVLKEYYPAYGMRQMSDHDILFDATHAEEVRRIMEDMGYVVKRFGGAGVHDVYQKEPVCNFELHRALFGALHEVKLRDYYFNVAERLLPAEGTNYGKCFSPEDFYVYVTAHEYKHYSKGGTGLRSVLDTYAYLMDEKADRLDWKYVQAEVEKLGIADFERQNRSLAMHLFGGEELTAEDRKMLEYVYFSGTYGNLRQCVENTMQKKRWGKVRYAAYRICIPISKKNPRYTVFLEYYPMFYKHRLLLPFLPFIESIKLPNQEGLRRNSRR